VNRVVCAGYAPAVSRAVSLTEPSRRGFRRLACKLLLAGYLDAGHGDASAQAWIGSPSATVLADLVGLPYWPPRPDQFYSYAELQRRAALSVAIR
jgi:hypothetical protein